MDELRDFIQVYDNVFDSNICNFLIAVFEQFQDKHEIIDNKDKQTFTQFNLTENREIAQEVNQVHNILIQKTFEYKEKYYEFVDGRVFPQEHAFEQFRIKKYKNDGTDYFDTHVDVIDHATARRFLSFFWYLNDVNEGGETVFKDFSIKPKQGSLLVFPPLWMFPHKANPPVSNPKYLLHTYLHYK